MIPALFLASVLPVCAAAPQDIDARLDGSAPVLSINGELISADEYARWLIDTGGSRFARDFAERWTILREAEAQGLEATEEMIREKLQFQIDTRIQGAFKGEHAGWVAELERLDRTEAGYWRQMMTELESEVAAKLLTAKDRVVPEDKIVRDWERIYGPYGKDLGLRMIFFKVEVETGDTAEQTAENRRLAMAEKKAIADVVRQRLLDGEDFGDLCAQFCEDSALRDARGVPDRDFRRGNHWPHQVIDQLCEMAPGELTEPVYAKGGWWLIRVEEVEYTPLEEVRDEITQMLLEKGPEQDEIGRVWNSLTEDVEFEIHEELFTGGESLEGGEVIGLTINGTPIPRRVYAAWLLALRGEYQSRHFAQDWLVAKKARAAGIEISDEAAEERVQSYIEWMLTSNPTFKGSREAWVASLSMRGQTVEDFMREKLFRAKLDLMAQELMLREREVTEEMVRDEYERQFGEDGRWLEARMIMVNVEVPELMEFDSQEELNAARAAAVDAARQEAATYVKRLREGEDFATIARQHSDEELTAADGGRIPGRFRPDAWPYEIAAAVRTLELGDVSGPLYTGRAYVIFELVDERVVSYEDARQDIYEELRDRQPTLGDIAGYRNVLTKTSEIEILPGMAQ